VTIRRIEPYARLCNAVIHGQTVYLAGQCAEDTSLDMKGQTEDILRQIDALLGSVGSSKSKLLQVTIFITDLRDFDAMNEAWDAWVDKDNLPARATVEVSKLADPGWKLEMTAIAAL